MQRITSPNNTSFQAIPLSQWKCFSVATKSPKSITIAELEKQDCEFMQKIKNHWITHPESKDVVKNSIVESALLTIEAILSGDCEYMDKVKTYVAIQNYKPCGILIGNMPKRIRHTTGNDGVSISYSSRHNQAKNETEIDWLATWTPKGEENLKGVGKALVAEFFGSLKKDRLRDVFVNSEIPENSYATNFYESLGFEWLSKKRPQIVHNTSREYLVSNFVDPKDRVVPMIITKSKIQACFADLSKRMFRQEFLKTSVNAEDLINIES